MKFWNHELNPSSTPESKYLIEWSAESSQGSRMSSKVMVGVSFSADSKVPE